MSFLRLFIAAGLAATAAAYTQPTSQTYGALLTPNLSDAVTQGQSFTVTWDNSGHSTDGVTVSLVLCKGPGTNCVLQPTAIVEGVPAAQASYNWAVPCSLSPGVQSTDTGYGMLIIVDGTGEFQYSTQFSVNAGSSCSSSSTVVVSSSASTGSVTSTSSSPASTSSAASTSSGGAESSSTVVVSSSMSSSSAEASASAHSSNGSTSSHATSGSPTSSKMATSTTPAAVGTGTSTGSASASASPTQFHGGATKLASGAFGVVAAALVAVLAL